MYSAMAPMAWSVLLEAKAAIEDDVQAQRSHHWRMDLPGGARPSSQQEDAHECGKDNIGHSVCRGPDG
jgi:hypothetical protein